MMNVAWTVSIRLHLKVDWHTRIFGGRRMMMHDKSRVEVMLDRGEHPTMPLNYCYLVWLAFKQPGGRIMLSLQFKFLALKGHISTARAMKDHIIRVTCLETCPFGLLDAHTYSLYRDVFFFWVFSLILSWRLFNYYTFFVLLRYFFALCHYRQWYCPCLCSLHHLQKFF